MNAFAAITDPLLRRAFGRELAPRTLTVLLETAPFFLAPVPGLGAVQASPQTAEPVPWAPRAGLAMRLRDFAMNRHE